MENLQPGYLYLTERKCKTKNHFADNEESESVLSIYTEILHIHFSQNWFSSSLKVTAMIHNHT